MNLKPLLLTAAVSAVAFTGTASATSDAVPAPTSKAAYTAKIVQTTNAYSSPGSKTVVQKLQPEAPIYKGAYRLLVLESTVKGGQTWLKVRLPKRPNTAEAWVLSDDVLVAKTAYRIVVDLSDRKVSLLKNGKTIKSSKAVVGSSKTPTPTGVHAILESVPQPGGSKGKLGPYVIALTAHSNVHKTFDGGDGRVGIHGYEKLGNGLGTAASNGCVRIPISFLKQIVAQAGPGTPVAIQQ